MSIPLSLDAAGLVRSRLGKFLVIAAGALGIGAVVWWFLIRRESTDMLAPTQEIKTLTTPTGGTVTTVVTHTATGDIAQVPGDLVHPTFGPGPVLVSVDPSGAVTGIRSPGTLVGR